MIFPNGNVLMCFGNCSEPTHSLTTQSHHGKRPMPVIPLIATLMRHAPPALALDPQDHAAVLLHCVLGSIMNRGVSTNPNLISPQPCTGHRHRLSTRFPSPSQKKKRCYSSCDSSLDNDTSSAVPSAMEKEHSDFKLGNFLKIVLWMQDANRSIPTSS